MSDELTTGQAPEITNPAPEVDAPESQAQPEVQAPEDEPFDKERAMRTIRELRQKEKLAKELQQRVSDYERREQEAEMARLSKEEQLAKQLQQREAELEFERQQARDKANQYELQLQASRAGVVDPEAAAKLLDWGALDYDSEGRPTNLGDVLNDLLERKPYLRAQPAEAHAPRTPVSATNPATRQTSSASRIYTATEIADRAFYLANKEDITRALREGRIRDE